ncbi:hypothetical protein HYR99_22480 [Candidatus Poribacteria bacterium]|nr:hypothetical protein [Candidatus Poribacteria bacterium]
MKWNFLSKIFEGAVSIEKSYNDCDKAINKLRAYNERVEKMRENHEDVSRFPADEKAVLDQIVNHAIEKATQLVNMEPERNWPGVFREMHKNLATIYFELHEYDKVREACEKLRDYGEVGRQDAEEVLQKLKDKEGGKVDTREEVTATV